MVDRKFDSPRNMLVETLLDTMRGIIFHKRCPIFEAYIAATHNTPGMHFQYVWRPVINQFIQDTNPHANFPNFPF